MRWSLRDIHHLHIFVSVPEVSSQLRTEPAGLPVPRGAGALTDDWLSNTRWHWVILRRCASRGRTRPARRWTRMVTPHTAQGECTKYHTITTLHCLQQYLGFISLTYTNYLYSLRKFYIVKIYALYFMRSNTNVLCVPLNTDAGSMVGGKHWVFYEFSPYIIYVQSIKFPSNWDKHAE